MIQDEYKKLCEIGDKMYRITKRGVVNIVIKDIMQYPHCVYKDDLGNTYFNRNFNKTFFKTKEEAENELQLRKNIAKKRELLKEYEIQLNDKLGIKDHFVLK